jgi:hypothetical protein
MFNMLIRCVLLQICKQKGAPASRPLLVRLLLCIMEQLGAYGQQPSVLERDLDSFRHRLRAVQSSCGWKRYSIRVLYLSRRRQHYSITVDRDVRCTLRVLAGGRSIRAGTVPTPTHTWSLSHSLAGFCFHSVTLTHQTVGSQCMCSCVAVLGCNNRPVNVLC